VADDDWFEIKRILTLHYADKSGNSYRYNLSAQSHGNSSFKRSPRTSSNLNPFSKAQGLYHLNAVSRYHGSSANFPNYPLQANDKLRSEGEFGNTDDKNFMTDASLAFHTQTFKDGARLQFLIDTGANKNFISPQTAKGCSPLFKPFKVTVRT